MKRIQISLTKVVLIKNRNLIKLYGLRLVILEINSIHVQQGEYH